MFGAGLLTLRHLLVLLTTLLLLLPLPSQSSCSSSCSVSLASYYITSGQNLTYISSLFGYFLGDIIPRILPYNPNITNQDSVTKNTRINIPFSCDCIDSAYLGHTFQYKVLPSDTYDTIADTTYAGLTTAFWLKTINSFPELNIPDGRNINVTINCSCGDAKVSEDYGLFATYPLRPGQTMDSVALEVGLPDAGLLQKYNPAINFSSGRGIAFVPARDKDGNFTRLNVSKSAAGISGGAIAGIIVAAAVVLVLVSGIYVILRRRKTKKVTLLPSAERPSSSLVSDVEVTYQQPGISSINGVTVDRAVEFSWEELSKATNNFSMNSIIGRGGFGAVYYAELRGEKTAIKKMDTKASKEFLAELKVLSQVHHLNLVRLIGYCTQDALFLVYEYIENGNLSQHLRGSDKKDPLSWSTRVQIALDSARALEYIHEHTVPVYIHRDIKSPNILIDKNYRAKVADFGLAKLTRVASSSHTSGTGNTAQSNTKLAGTFGYMAPEYAQYGEVSTKIDVYAFGVVLYELISAKQAIIKTNEFYTETKGLVQLFNEVLTNPDPSEDLRKVVDPRLGDDYPVEDVLKLAQLARACTQDSFQLRPSMRTIVVALMTLSSATEDWDVGQFYENNTMASLMSGR